MAKNEFNFDELDFEVEGTNVKKETNKVVNFKQDIQVKDLSDTNDICDIITIDEVRKYNDIKIHELVKSGIQKLINIGKELNEEYVEREEVIKNTILALISGVAMFLYGPPGTGNNYCRLK